MTSPTATTTTVTAEASGVRYRLDPSRSSMGFRVRTFWGLLTVKGHFGSVEGTVDLGGGSGPAVDVRIDAASLDTGNAKRDTHLRSTDFFDVSNHPEIRFTADSIAFDAGTIRGRGVLEVAGRTVTVAGDATLRQVDGGLEVEGTTRVDHRALGMTWSPLGMLRPPATLVIKAYLLADS